MPDRARIVLALRDEMRTRGLNAFVLPRYDAHQAEYVAPHDERLAYVTGFTGTAGLAIVTGDTVAMFVDGRYVVQAANQCPEPLFSHHHLHDEPPEFWLATVAEQGWSVGFDAMHLPPVLHGRFTDALNGSRARFVAVEDNPVDAIWPNQPAPPNGIISAFPTQFTGVGADEKISQLVATLQSGEVDLLVETQPDNIAWLLNVRGSDVAYCPVPQSFLLARSSGQVDWFVETKKFSPEICDHLPDTVTLHPPAAFLPTLSELSGRGACVQYDAEFSPAAVRLALDRSSAQGRAASSPLTLSKARKNPTEIEGLRACHVEDAIAWTEFCGWLHAEVPARASLNRQVTELEAKDKIQSCRRDRAGYLEESFNTISAAGANAAMCHYATIPEDAATIDPEGTYLLDSGGQYETGTTDATRSFAFGKVRPDGYDRAYTAVFKAFHALATLRFPPGTQGHHIDAICRRPLWDLGLDYDHGTGHGIGHRLSVHEHPQRIGKPYNPVDLVPGMILSIEPGYYEMGRFGIRIENLFEIVEEDDGFMVFSNLTWIPIQTDMLLTDKLSQAERSWLNAYNAEVLRRISSQLSPAGRAWAERACAAIA